MATIQLQDISKAFGTTRVIDSVDLTVEDGSFVALVGPSGCGKSTLLRMIAGLEPVSSGHILIDGQDVVDTPAAKRGLAMVFQSYALYPHMTVAANIGFPLKMAGMAKPEIDTKVRVIAAMLDLTALLGRRPGALSGGQRQRVAIGRAVVREPKAFLFDEPLSNLDAELRVKMRLELIRLQRQLKTTAIYVTHDQIEAMTMADRIAVLNAGRIEQFGTPQDLYDRPANLSVAGFIGSPRMNFIEGEIAATFGCEKIGIRPEHLHLVGEGGDLSGRVEITENLGSDVFLYVQVPQVGQVCVRHRGESRVNPGDPVALTFDRRHFHRFAPDGEALHFSA